MKVVCPSNASHQTFVTTAHEVHDWEVDGKGNFIRDLGVLETTHRPTPGNGNTWSCTVCGIEAKTEA